MLKHAFEQIYDEALFEGIAEADDGFRQAEASSAGIYNALQQFSEISDLASTKVATSPAEKYRAEAEHSELPPRAPPQKFSPGAKPVISPDLEVEDIKRLRRTYALANHPDRVPADLRDEASKAMAQANAEFDRALRSARSRKDVSG